MVFTSQKLYTLENPKGLDTPHPHSLFCEPGKFRTFLGSCCLLSGVMVQYSQKKRWPNVTDSPLFTFHFVAGADIQESKKHGLIEIWTFECLRINFSKNLYKLNSSKSESKRFTAIFLFCLLARVFLLHLLSEFAPNQLSMVSSDECPSRNLYWSFPASRFGDSLPGFRINNPVQFMYLICVTSTTSETSFLSNWKGMNKYCWWLNSCTCWGW